MGVSDISGTSTSNKTKIKKVRWLKVTASPEELKDALLHLPSNAVNQKKVLAHFIDSVSDEQILSKVTENVGVPASTVNSLVKKGLFELVEREQYRDPC